MWKISCLIGTECFLHAERNTFFNEKGNLNRISSKYGQLMLDTYNYLTNSFYFFLRDHEICRHSFYFVVNALAVALFVLGDCLIVLIAWVKVRYVLFSRIVIKLLQSISGRNYEALKITKYSIWMTKSY